MNEILGLIIAAIGIFIVLAGAYKLYEVTINQESENAKAILNSLEGKINNLNSNEVGRFSIRGVKDWFLVGFSKNDASRIDKCLESCICICKGDKNDLKTSCQENGFCRDLKFERVSVFEFAKIMGKEIVDSNGNAVREEEVVKDILNPRYYERRRWYKDGIYDAPLLNDACPQFYESNLVEILIYKNDDSLSILKISEKKDELVGLEAACGK